MHLKNKKEKKYCNNTNLVNQFIAQINQLTTPPVTNTASYITYFAVK